MTKMVEMYWSEFLTWKSIFEVKMICKYELQSQAMLEKFFTVESIVTSRKGDIMVEISKLHSYIEPQIVDFK